MKRSLPLLSRYIATAAAVLMLAACVSNPSQTSTLKAADTATTAVFYPPLPNSPRIQYLTTIASELDLAVKKSGFAEFIVGDEKKEVQQLMQPYGVAMYKGKLYVADTNDNTAPGYAIASWRGGFSQNIRQWRLSEFVRVDNLFDRNYIGSVKLNDSNQQYYEPGSNRNWLVGLNAGYQF